jgi:hypothetical protein
MKNITRYSVALFSALLFYNFKCTKEKATKYVFGEDVIIQLSNSEGMTGNFINALIVGSKSHISYKNNLGEDNFEFNVDEKKMKALIDVFLDNNFPTIKTTQKKVYDRGGNTITVRYRDTTIIISDAGGSFVADEDLQRFNNCVNAITKITTEEINKLTTTVYLNFDEQFTDMTHFANVSFSSSFIFVTDTVQAGKYYAVKLNKGTFDVYIDYFKRLSKQNVTTLSKKINICGGDTFFFGRDGTELTLSQKPECAKDER